MKLNILIRVVEFVFLEFRIEAGILNDEKRILPVMKNVKEDN